MKHTLNDTMLSTLDDVLGSIGLARRTGVAVPAMGSFAAGAICGAVAALLLAPTSGDELIAKLGARFKTLRDTVKSLSAGEGSDKTQERRERPRSADHTKHS